MKEKIKIGLLGLGTVGSGVVKTLNDLSHLKNIEIIQIAVRDLNKNRHIEGLNQDILTTNPEEIVNNPEIKILVEVIGGINPAFELIKTAIKNGKHIVTANKELIARHGEELFELAKEANVVILYEAAVAGGIPIIMPLKTSLAGNKITKIAGILNGTTNFILTKMKKEHRAFDDALKEAQKLGYAEADPSGDIQGYDAVYKIAILASLAFNKRIDINKIYREGIEDISTEDMAYAKEFGYKIKLVGLAQTIEDDKFDVRVHPMLISEKHPLAHIDDVMNAVVVEASPAGRVMFSGLGAGGFPTASSVIGDVLALAEEIEGKYPLPMMRCKHSEAAEQIKIEETKNKYYIKVNAVSHLGVIGELGMICGKNKINLYSIIQKGVREDNSATIVLLTDLAYEKDIKNALAEINKKSTVKIVENVIRVMD